MARVYSTLADRVIDLPEKKREPSAEAQAMVQLAHDLDDVKRQLAEAQAERDLVVTALIAAKEAVARLEGEVAGEKTARQAAEAHAMTPMRMDYEPHNDSALHAEIATLRASLASAQTMLAAQTEARRKAEEMHAAMCAERDEAIAAKHRLADRPIALTFDVEYGHDGKPARVHARER